MKSPNSEPVLDGRAVTGPRELRDPRSREYAVQTMSSLKRFLDSKTFSAKHAESELQEIKTYKHWQVLGFENLNAYLKAELGYGTRQLRARLAQDLAADPDVKPAAAHGGDCRSLGPWRVSIARAAAIAAGFVKEPSGLRRRIDEGNRLK